MSDVSSANSSSCEYEDIEDEGSTVSDDSWYFQESKDHKDEEKAAHIYSLPSSEVLLSSSNGSDAEYDSPTQSIAVVKAFDINKQTVSEPSPSPCQTIAVQTKRTISNVALITPGNSPIKKRPKKASTIHEAVTQKATKGVTQGLLRYFDLCTPEEYEEQTRRANFNTRANLAERQAQLDKVADMKKKRKKEMQRSRQQRHRKKLYDSEILSGSRTPGGTKRRRKTIDPTFNPKISGGEFCSAELSRPARNIRSIDFSKKRKPQGRKRKNLQKNASYVNWHGYYLWTMIDNASRSPEVGFQMRSSDIVRYLNRKYPELFDRLRYQTVERWIDRSGSKPKWTEKALAMAEQGFLQTSSGGRIGIMVSTSAMYYMIYYLPSCSPNSHMLQRQSQSRLRLYVMQRPHFLLLVFEGSSLQQF